MVKKYVKGKNTVKRAKIPVVKKPSTQKHADPVKRQKPTQALNERRAARTTKERLAYAKKQRKRMGSK